MPIATFRGERSVDDIADTLFTDLSDRQREVAALAILKANPQLAEINKVPNGAVLRVPRIPELRPKNDRSLDSPDAQIANEIGKALNDFDKRLGARIEQAIRDNASQTALLESPELEKALAKSPDLQKLAGQTAKAIDARNAAQREQQKAVAGAIRRMTEELNKGLG